MVNKTAHHIPAAKKTSWLPVLKQRKRMGYTCAIIVNIRQNIGILT